MVKYYPLHSNINTQCISYLGVESLCSVAIVSSTAKAQNNRSSVNLELDYLLFLSSLFPFPVPLGGVRNLRVIDPTFTTLNAVWEAADGNVQGYKVLYARTAGGPQMVVGMSDWLSL